MVEMPSSLVSDLMIIEEKQYLLKKKIFELVKLSAEVDGMMEKIANDYYYDGIE